MNKLTDLIAPSFYHVHNNIKKQKYTHYMLGGGRGSTKSSFIGIEIPLGIMRDSEANAVILRQYSTTLRESVYTQLLWGIDKLGVSHYWKPTINPLRLTYLPTGQSILFSGLDDPQKIKSIKFRHGYAKFIWFEEMTQFRGMEEIRSVLQSLMRGGEVFQVFYSYNPPANINNFVNQEALIDRPDRMIHKSDYRSVPAEWLGEPFIDEAKLLKERNPRAYQHEYIGEITGTGTEVFENLVERTITKEEIQCFDRVYNGVDWGWFPDPWAFVRVHYDAARHTLFFLDEAGGNKMGNDRTAQIVKSKITQGERITCDSAEPKSVRDYKDRGLNAASAKKGVNSVDYSMKWLQSLKHIVMDRRRTPHAYKEFSTYEYERNKNGDIINRYVDRDNHYSDATRYATEPIWHGSDVSF